MKKHLCTFVRFLLVFIVGFAVGNFYCKFKNSPIKAVSFTVEKRERAIVPVLKAATDPPVSSTGEHIEQNSFDSEIKVHSTEWYLVKEIEYYKEVMTTLFGSIGVILAASFAFVYARSISQAEEIARKSLKEEAFTICLSNQIEESIENFYANEDSEIPDLKNRMNDLKNRMEFIEKAVNEKNYEIKNADESNVAPASLADEPGPIESEDQGGGAASESDS